MSEIVLVGPEEAEDESLVTRLPSYVQERVRYLQAGYFELSQEELEKEVFINGKVDLLSSRLKLNFWNEYDRVCKVDKMAMRVGNIIAGVCTLSQFKKFIEDKHRLAWLILVPADYKLALSDIHELSMAQMREIMQMDNYDAKGAPNVKLLEVKFKVAQHVDMRLKGAIIQRIDQRNMNVNVNASGPEAEKAAKDVALSMDEINLRISNLRRKSDSLLAPGGVQVDLLSAITAENDIIDVHENPRKLPDR